MGLGRGWTQVLKDNVVDFDSAANERFAVHFERVIEAVEEVAENGSKDEGHRTVLHSGVTDYVEVSHVSRGNVVPSATGGAAGKNINAVNDLPEGESLPVVPTTVVEPLPQNLDRRLGPVFLFLGHVDVVDENDELLPRRGAEDTLPPLITLAINHVLGGILASLCAKHNGERDILIRKSELQVPVDINTLSCSRRSSHHAALGVLDELVQQESVSHGV
mmetsp:Transcript_14995/g.30845  ORF Transcript_14995/g.30845 Transcript_14995/m.30845 type:complete len:219 (-) Transcript_14995:6685-7341(-)